MRLVASLEQHAQCLIKLTVFRCAESVVLPYSVLMNCVTRGFYSFRKFLIVVVAVLERQNSGRSLVPSVSLSGMGT
jgi:hypothetical protein